LKPIKQPKYSKKLNPDEELDPTKAKGNLNGGIKSYIKD
jgi:hypothetical protein